jgi:hypothetical protein
LSGCYGTDFTLGSTDLYKAAVSGDVEGVRALIDSGADIDELDWRGYSALYGAAHKASRGDDEDTQCEIVKLLLDSGADINIQTREEGRTPLYGGSPKIVALLLLRGADRHIEDEDGNSAARDVGYYSTYPAGVRIATKELLRRADDSLKKDKVDAALNDYRYALELWDYSKGITVILESNPKVVRIFGEYFTSNGVSRLSISAEGIRESYPRSSSASKNGTTEYWVKQDVPAWSTGVIPNVTENDLETIIYTLEQIKTLESTTNSNSSVRNIGLKIKIFKAIGDIY